MLMIEEVHMNRAGNPELTSARKLMLLNTNHMFQWKEKVLFVKISQAMSRTTRPNIGLCLLILMHIHTDSNYEHKLNNS